MGPAIEFMTVERLGAIVATRRRELGMTQARLAERGGVSRQWLVRFEGGTHSVETGLALRILRALELHLELTTTSNLPEGPDRHTHMGVEPVTGPSHTGG